MLELFEGPVPVEKTLAKWYKEEDKSYRQPNQFISLWK